MIDEPRARAIARQPHEELPQLVDRHVGRVDDLVGHVADRVQPRPLVADAFAGRAIRRQRMRPPRLAEAPHERRVAGLEEDQDRVEPRIFRSRLKTLRKRRQKVALAHVDDDRDLLDVAAAAATASPASGSASSAGCRRRSSRGPRARGWPATCPEPDRPVSTMNGWPRLASRAFARLAPSALALRRAVLARFTVALRLELFVVVVGAQRRAGAGCVRSSRSASARAAWWPRARSSWLRAATSTRIAMFRPGATGIRISGTRSPRISIELVVEAEPLVFARRDPSVRAARRARRASTSASRRCRTAP